MTRDEAARAVLEELNRTYHEPGDELVLLEELTLAKPYGWVFFYNSRKFVETRSFAYALGGNGPVVIEHASGRISRLGTARPPEDEIAAFEQARGLVPPA